MKISQNSTDTGLAKHVAILRIVFGLMWAIDAAFKWLPAFAANFLQQVTAAADGQPGWLMPWFDFWTRLLSYHTHAFVTITAIIESLIAIALIIGLARRATYLGAALFSFLIWGIAEGFGGPYGSDSSDIGTAIIYVVVFLSLYGLERMARPARWAVDNYIIKRISWWSTIANPEQRRL